MFCFRQAELNDEIEEMKHKEEENIRPRSSASFRGSDGESDEGDDDDESTGGLSGRAGSATRRRGGGGGGGVSYEEFNV